LRQLLTKPTGTRDRIKQAGAMKNSKMITVYRFNPMTIYRGGGYPIDSVEMTDWNEDKSEAEKAFNKFNLKSISKSEIEEMNNGNLFGDKVWLLGEAQSATIPVSEYKRYLHDTSNIEIVGYACDYDFKTEKEKSFMPNGKRVSKKLYQSIYGSKEEIAVS